MRDTLLSGTIWHFVKLQELLGQRNLYSSKVQLPCRCTTRALGLRTVLYGFNWAYNSRLPAVDYCFHRQRLKTPKMYMSTFAKGSIFYFRQLQSG